MPAHRKPLRLRKFLVATVGVAVTGAGVAYAAQGEPEPVRSAPEPPALTGAPSESSTPSGAATGERDPRASRSSHSARPELRDKAKDKATEKPKPKPSPTESSEPVPTPDPEPTKTVTTTAPKPEPTRTQPASGSGIVGGTNAARADAGLSALSVNSCLTEMAQRQAERLAAAGTLFHQNLSSVMSSCGMSTAGENVAMNYTGPSGMVNQWLESPGHRANMMSSRFTLIGVGTAQGRDGAWYGVQVFGAG